MDGRSREELAVVYEVTIEIKRNIATLRCLDKTTNKIVEKKYEAVKGITRNATALATLIEALEHMTKKSYLTIYLDNQYVYGALVNNWLSDWIKNNWENAKGTNVANKQLWIYLGELLGKHEFEVKELSR